MIRRQEKPVNEPQITGEHASVTAGWRREITLSPGSVPDRPVPYSSDGGVYRPVLLQLEFTARAAGSEVTGLCPEPGDIRQAGLVIGGIRLRRDGSLGSRAVSENFYGSRDGVPDWALALADATLAALVQQAL
jgi:hypothetical protein